MGRDSRGWTSRRADAGGRLLVEHLERVVRYEAVVAAYESAGGSSHAGVGAHAADRIGTRVRPVGLELVTVRRRGVLLTQQPRVAG